MGMEFPPTWLRQVTPLLHETTLTTAQRPRKTVPIKQTTSARKGADYTAVKETDVCD